MTSPEARTKPDPSAVAGFLTGVNPPARQAEAQRLVAIFRDVTGFAPLLWGSSIVGFGRYAYTYDSGHSGEAPATGFSPRKAELSLYLNAAQTDNSALLAQLGKHRTGKACLYLRHLDDADQAVLRRLIRVGLDDLAQRWTILPA